jgi:hypothetical protein
MLRSAGRRLLQRLRRVTPAVAAKPPRQWADDLAAAGTTDDAWVGRRLMRDAVYVSVSDDEIAHLSSEHAGLCERTIAAAMRVLDHEFDLLGSGPFVPVDPERPASPDGYRPIDWYWDPIANLRFPRAVPLADWNFDRMRPGLADIKLPWELARCQHWPVLGQAYRLTGDERFAVEIARELRDFMAANPVGTAVNWACTMDVALRAANWAIGLQLVKGCPLLDTAFWRDAYRALFDHGAFIENHLENTYEVTSNHFLSDVVGLFFVAAVFRDLPRGQLWWRQCREWIEQELAVQVLPDGADYESSVPYHRLVAELFLGAMRLADFAGDPFPASVRGRVESMVAFLAAIERPDGLMPQVGDADDGRLHVLSEYGTWRPQDGRHLFGPAGAVFERGEWASRGGEWADWERVWWGLERPPQQASGDRASHAAEPLIHFPRAGVTVMRGGNDYLLITNGIVGTAGFGNHKHNDLLAFEYHVDGAAVVVDAGSFVYTSNPDARNRFRSTASHNTLGLDDIEQNELRPEWLFRLFEKAHPEHLVAADREDALVYRGRHRGYERLADPVTHERTFEVSKRAGGVTITDVLRGRGTHRLRWHFHFAPGVEIDPVVADQSSIRTRSGARVRFGMPAGLRHTIDQAWYSPSYGVKTPCLCLDSEIEMRVDGSAEFVWRFSR